MHTTWRSAATTRLLSTDRSLLEGPAQRGQALIASIPCRTTADPAAPPSHHAIMVKPGWSTEVPHDLEAERVATALGGHCSCLALEGVVIPALRAWATINLRLAPVDIRPLPSSDGWRIGTPAACCRHRTFTCAAEAATHARSHTHVAHTHGAAREVLAALSTSSQQAFGPSMVTQQNPTLLSRAASVTRAGLRDVTYLWEAGMSPATILRIHSRLGIRHPLPRRFYLGVAALRPDLRWLRECLQQSRSNDTAIATWLAWTASSWDRDARTARPRMLQLGVAPDMVLVLGEAGIDPEEIAEYAARTCLTPDEVARSL